MKNGLVIDRDVRSWYKNNRLHRKDDPTVECGNGNKEWYINGKRHREDGPAIEWNDGEEE